MNHEPKSSMNWAGLLVLFFASSGNATNTQNQNKTKSKAKTHTPNFAGFLFIWFIFGQFTTLTRQPAAINQIP